MFACGCEVEFHFVFSAVITFGDGRIDLNISLLRKKPRKKHISFGMQHTPLSMQYIWGGRRQCGVNMACAIWLIWRGTHLADKCGQEQSGGRHNLMKNTAMCNLEMIPISWKNEKKRNGKRTEPVSPVLSRLRTSCPLPTHPPACSEKHVGEVRC